MRSQDNPADLHSAYQYGYDAGVNGPNTTNCHFSLFHSPDMTKAWERGNAVGLVDRMRIAALRIATGPIVLPREQPNQKELASKVTLPDGDA
jgi:ribosome modulation factor